MMMTFLWIRLNKCAMCLILLDHLFPLLCLLPFIACFMPAILFFFVCVQCVIMEKLSENLINFKVYL